MRTSLAELLATKPVVLVDGATGTNYMERGLGPGDPPELWNVVHPERVRGLHQDFVDAGADIILTNTFGCTTYRLKLHNNQHRVHELASAAARIAREVADSTDRPVAVAGSVGPLGELFQPMGLLTEADAIEAFTEQIIGLRDGGVDVIWIETMFSAEEARAAAQAAIDVGMPYTTTMSFDTAGRTMMGILPENLSGVFEGLSVQPLAMGANCGVGASDILLSILAMSGAEPDRVYISKGNCGVPHFQGTEIVYSGTTEVMAAYAALAINAGARIIGGCCGTSPAHLAAMRKSLDDATVGDRPTLEEIVATTGPLTNSAPNAESGNGRERSRGRRSAE
ncbi:MAG: Cobalamin-dependent methionine synthase [Ilumatobacteraceae bacterium]|nr:Cobalamin-dependent methionine synthase [Ilumatobacteraceae bacterium]